MGKPLFELAIDLHEAIKVHPARSNLTHDIRFVPENEIGTIRRIGVVADGSAGEIRRIAELAYKPGEGYYHLRRPNVILPPNIGEVMVSGTQSLGFPLEPHFDIDLAMGAPRRNVEHQWAELSSEDAMTLENGLIALLKSLKDNPNKTVITVPLPSQVKK